MFIGQISILFLWSQLWKNICGEVILMFDINEMGMSDWEDRKSKSAIVPIDMKDWLIRHIIR
jgi:hypothetical protein